MRFCGANIPERATRAAIFPKVRPAAAAPQVRPRAGVNVRKQIFVTRALVVIEAKIHAATVRAHVSGGTMVNCDVMDELAAEIKIGEKIILTFKIKTVMAGATGCVRLPVGFEDNALERAELAL